MPVSPSLHGMPPKLLSFLTAVKPSLRRLLAFLLLFSHGRVRTMIRAGRQAAPKGRHKIARIMVRTRLGLTAPGSEHLASPTLLGLSTGQPRLPRLGEQECLYHLRVE